MGDLLQPTFGRNAFSTGYVITTQIPIQIIFQIRVGFGLASIPLNGFTQSKPMFFRHRINIPCNQSVDTSYTYKKILVKIGAEKFC